MHLGKELTLTAKQIEGVFKGMIKNKPKAMEWNDRAFLLDGMKVVYKVVVEKRFNVWIH